MVQTPTSAPEPAVRRAIFGLIERELDRAYEKHGREPWGRHEWYAITLEELEEAWLAIKADQPLPLVAAEIVQTAAMCVRYLETGDRYLDPPADDLDQLQAVSVRAAYAFGDWPPGGQR